MATATGVWTAPRAHGLGEAWRTRPALPGSSACPLSRPTRACLCFLPDRRLPTQTQGRRRPAPAAPRPPQTALVDAPSRNGVDFPSRSSDAFPSTLGREEQGRGDVHSGCPS